MLFSIIVPVYKAEKTVCDCINSVIKQIYDKWELCLIIDGSPDNSYEICKTFAKRDKRIKIINKPNGGVSSARNTGLAIAEGDYVCFLDSDDFYDPKYLLNFFKVLSVYPYDLVASGFILKGKRDFDVKNYFFDNKSYSKFDIKKFMMTSKEKYMFGVPWNKCYKRSIILDNGIFFDESISSYEDELFVTNYLLHCNNVRTISDLTYYYIISSINSLSKQYLDFSIRKKTASLLYNAAKKLSQEIEYQNYCKEVYYNHYLLAIEELYSKHNYSRYNLFHRRLIINEVINDALQQSDFIYFKNALARRHLSPNFYKIEIVSQLKRLKLFILDLIFNKMRYRI